MIALPISPKLIGVGLLVAALGVQTYRLHDMTAKRDAAVAAKKLQIAAYREAAVRVTLRHQEAARQTEQEQQRISTDASTDYQQRLAAVRLRAKAAADTRSAGAAHLPGVPDATGGPDGAACQAGLSPADALTATEQAIQLDALQKWVRKQQAVGKVVDKLGE
ncbi:hypothetical protein BSL82_10210 [Tardibacter chloracetimidivorans]|uniref:Lysis protein n=1 Tax=Tardibacter chloracetimidivorans TaxID=1921510 RepID=A0A1L3ZVG1_9SPHN|nr:hypothetical protein [Tardibacter chloracetimidivorans]API59646.1 hypothetical protein BSL82_10210 [Tardibacter chloracetimidivorans]